MVTFQDLITYITAKSNVVIHYVTRDPNDQIFEIARENTQIKPYYIGDKRLITLMMKLDADILVMTTPDLDNYHIKRSYIRKDIEYIYIDHGVGSPNLQLRTHALDHFDTVFCTSPLVRDELLGLEALYQTPKKNLLACGYSLMDTMCAGYEKLDRKASEISTILIAPSWQKDNVMDLCLDTLLDTLLDKGCRIIVRPHPQYVRLYPGKMEAVLAKYRDRLSKDFIIQTDFSDSSIVYRSDIMITDWSNIGYEFSFTTLKPTLYINTPMKVMNPEWEKLDIVPMDIQLRDRIGKSFAVEDIPNMPQVIEDMQRHQDKYSEQVRQVREETVFNFSTGKCAQIEGDYILHQLVERRKRNRSSE